MADIEPIGLALQTDGIEKGIKKLSELAQQGPKVEQSMAGISAESKKVAKSLADLGSGAGDGLKKTGDAAQKAATGIKASGTAAREAVTDTASLARAVAGLTVEEQKHIAMLVQEANGLRMSRGEMEAYKAAQKGMSAGAQEISKALGDRITALKAEQKALADGGVAMDLFKRAAQGAAAVLALWDTAKFIKESTLLAARYETMGVVMGVAGNNAGYTRKEMDSLALSLQKSGISMLQSRNSLTQLATAHIDLAKAASLGRAAQDLAVVGGINSSEALGRMINGIKAGEVEILRTLGLNVNFEASYKKLAASLKISTDNLTENQKVMARTNSVLEASAAYAGIYEESMTTAGKAMSSLTRYWEDLKVKAGDAFLPALAESVNELTAALKEANKELADSGQEIDDIGKTLASGLKTAFQTVAVLAANVAFVFSTIGRSIGATLAQIDAATSGDFDGARLIGEEADKDSAAARKALDAYEAKILGITDAMDRQKDASRETAAAIVQQAAASGEAGTAAEQQRIAAAKAAEAYKTAMDASMRLSEAARQGQTVEEKRLEIAKQLRAEYEKTQSAAAGLSDAERVNAAQDFMIAMRANNAANQPTIDRNALLDSIAHVESGGRQTDRSGNVITSNQGALGMYQIMPSSGPHMAQLAGVEWSKARLEQDAGYGRTLASAYIDYLMRIFDNDAVKALTAYHSGQGNVGSAIAKAGATGDWLQYMGQQGQQYANLVLGGLTKDAKGNYSGLQPGVAPNKEAIAEQQKIREMQDATAAATASMRAQQEGYNKVMAEFLGMKATDYWKTLSVERQKAQEQDAIAKSNIDALMQSHQALQAALSGADSAWQDYSAATAGAASYTKEMAAEQARYDKVLQDSVKNGLAETTLMQLKSDHLRTMSSLQEKQAITSAASLKREADQLKAANESYGKSAIAIGEMRVSRLEDAAAAELQANGATKLYEALLAEAAQQRNVNEERRKSVALQASEGFNERIRTANEMASAAQQELKLMGLTGIERTKALAQLEAQLRIKKDIAALERQGLRGAELETASQEARTAAMAEANAKVNQAYVQEWGQTIQQVDNIFVQGFADMMNAGRSGWDSFCKSLKTSFYTMVAKEIYAMFAKPFVVKLVASLLGIVGGGGAASAAAGAVAGAGGGGGGLLGVASNANTVYNLFTGGMAGLLGGWATSIGMMIGSAAMTQFGMGMSGMYLAPGLVGPGVSTAAGAAGASFGEALSAIPGWGWALAGVGALFGKDIWNALFGRKLKESGVEGTFGGETGFEGNLYKYYKGGWFRSNKTTRQEMPEEMRHGFADQFFAMDKSIREMASAVGLGGDALDGFTAKFKVNLKGLSEEEANKKLQEEFQKIAEQMGGLVLTSEEYTHAGETQLEALTRLSTSITLANEWFKAVGDTLYTVGLAGADMASELMDAFGGADKFAAVTSNYYDKFFTDQEKVANQTRLLDEQLKKLGVETMPASREAFRNYINSIDVSTEAGRKLYASLLQMADVFDLIYKSAENIASLKEDLNVQLLRAKGDDEGATRLEREKQLRELEKYKDPELVKLQRDVWAAQDKKQAEEQAKQAAEAAKQAAEAAKSLAMSNLQAAISREKEYWNQFSADAKDALTKASSYWTLVTDSAKNLRASVDETSTWNAARGMVFIEQAIANARSGMGLSDYDQTKSAIEAATGGLIMDNYATKADLDYDKKVLAGQLDELGEYAGLAKSDAQKQIDLAADQLKRLDETLKFWQDFGKEQVDATLSVTAAIEALYKLLDPEEQARVKAEKDAQQAAANPGGSGGASFGGGGGYIIGSGDSGGAYTVGYTKDGRQVWSDGSISKDPITTHAVDFLEKGYDPFSSLNYSTGQHTQGKPVEWDEEKKLYVPKLNVGTNYLPSDMLVLAHQGERIIPKADNHALMAALSNQGGSAVQMAEVVAELRAVKQELQAIKAGQGEVAYQARKTASVLSSVTDGGLGMRNQPATA
ncbi:transglycosylase SLT domain-containing protein [Comamonas sp. J-3]|uniref:transglycosylase SLT domain-containing protein n=1 Tax=Comamonas trifloxystrobinivorans TaxID=3350256 RepID=UPI00372980F3